MRRAAAALALVALAVAPALAQRAVDWSTRGAVTASGSTITGNPRAAKRLVEYLSYTCPHCAEFHAQAAGPLARDLVRPGHVNVELRPAIRDGLDLTAALLARCGGPTRVFDNSTAILAGQRDWMAAGTTYARSAGAALDAMPRDEAVTAMARASGLFALMEARGYAPAALDACLTDDAAQATLARLSDQAWRVDRIPSTPYLTIDGAPVPGHDWADIRARLAARP